MSGAVPDAVDSAYSWARLGVTLLLATIGNVGIWAIIVVMPAVEAEFAIARADASLPYTLTMVGFAVGNFALGRAVDRVGAALTLAASGALTGLGFAAAALSGSVWTLAAAQVAIGFAAAAAFGPLIADISHWFLRRRGLAVAIAASGNYLCGAIWPLLLAGTLEADGWRAVYFTIAAVTGLSIPPLALFLRRRLPSDAHVAADARASAAVRATPFSPGRLQALLAIAGVGCCVAMSMPQVHIVSFSVDLGHGPVHGAQMLSAMLFGGALSRLVSGLIADRLGGVRTLLIGSFGQLLALILYLPFDGMAALYAVSLIFGLAQGGIVPSYALIVREYMPAREAGARVGLVIMATIVGMALGGWMTGWIHDVSGSYTLAFLNGIAWNVLNIAVMLLILVRSGPRLAASAA